MGTKPAGLCMAGLSAKVYALHRLRSDLECVPWCRREAGEPLPPPPKTAIAGPEYFGLTHPDVILQIESLDPEHLCSKYWNGKQVCALEACWSAAWDVCGTSIGRCIGIARSYETVPGTDPDFGGTMHLRLPHVMAMVQLLTCLARG